MAHLGNTVINGALRVLGGEYVDTINGVTVGSSPKFTDTTYTAATAAPGKVASASAQGSSTNYARQDHTHGIDLATGDSNGQVKIAGTNVSVKGLGTAAYTASTAYATSGHTHTLSIAADSGTSSLTMAANTKYKITAGGSSYVFTTPPDNNTQTITGVKGNAESSYRTGNVNLTAANIGAATSDHTHGISIATDSGTNQLTMSANTKYKITAGGSSYIFTTPVDNNTTYSSQAAASGGTAVSLVTTGEKYTWNNKSNLAIGTTSTTAAAGNHTHGNIQNGGTLQTNDITIANGDKIIVTDSSDSNKIARTSISFDGSTATQCLTKKGTWATFGTSNLAIGTTATTAAAGNHTHTISIAADSGTNQLTMAANTKYKITAGGSSYIFTTPPDNNTNNAVTQTATSTSSNYEVLFSATADNTTRTEGARKNSNLTFNPSTGNLTVTKINGVATTISSAVSAAVGDTSCTITNSAITTTSMLEPFASNSSGNIVSITNMTASAGSVKIYFPALTETTSFKVRISN